jgi:hypothetical protein
VPHPSGSVDPDTTLILTNTIYLMAAWTYPFRALSTVAAPFTRDDGQVVDVPMMIGPFDRMVYLEGDGWRAVARRKASDRRSAAVGVAPSLTLRVTIEASAVITRSASFRAASTYCTSFIRASACSGVLVRPRRNVQTSRLGASKVDMEGYGFERLQVVYNARL